MYLTSLISPGALACLLALLAPMTSFAQSCKPESIPATTPTSQFIDHGDGTVTDTKTGLMWKRCSEGQVWNGSTCSDTSESVVFFTWQGALQQAQAVNSTGGFAGQVDWRVPNPKELTSLVEEQCFEPAINITVFPTTYTSRYWSSSPYVNDSNFAWYMADDGVFWYLKSASLQVRLVRGGEQIDNLLLPPSNVKASDGTYSERVVVTWLGTVGAEDYEIWRGSNANPGEAVRVAAEVTVTSYNDTTVPYGSSYFWVKACNNSGCSDFSVPDTGYPALIPQ